MCWITSSRHARIGVDVGRSGSLPRPVAAVTLEEQRDLRRIHVGNPKAMATTLFAADPPLAKILLAA